MDLVGLCCFLAEPSEAADNFSPVAGGKEGEQDPGIPIFPAPPPRPLGLYDFCGGIWLRQNVARPPGTEICAARKFHVRRV